MEQAEEQAMRNMRKALRDAHEAEQDREQEAWERAHPLHILTTWQLGSIMAISASVGALLAMSLLIVQST